MPEFKPSREEIESALRAKFSPELHEHLPALASLLADAVSGKVPLAEFPNRVANKRALQALLDRLTGQTLCIGERRIVFGTREDKPIILGDQFNAQNSQGAIHRPSGQINQEYGSQRTAQTGGGAYFERGTHSHHYYGNVSPQRVDQTTLEAAVRKLATLSIDPIPDVKPLPPGSRMLLSPNPLFVGRKNYLQVLAAAFKTSHTAAIGQVGITAAIGMGGLGKTQLASEFVHRYGQYFAGGVFWLSFADPNTIANEIAECGGLVCLNLHSDFIRLPFEEQVKLVLSAWQSPLPRLLVFDNCEDEALLVRWRPRTGGCRILVTSRLSKWDAALGVERIPLGLLARSKSIALLRQHRPDLSPNDSVLNEIAIELGDLPLALHLAGSFLNEYQNTSFGQPAFYLEELRQAKLLRHPSLQAEGLTFSPTGHTMHVANTFNQSYKRLSESDLIDSQALGLLAWAACFAPSEPIPPDQLRATLKKATFQAEKALKRLVTLGFLVQEAKGALRLHRLLAVFVRNKRSDLPAQVAVKQALEEKSNRENESDTPEGLLELAPHLHAVIEAAKLWQDEHAAILCSTVGDHLKKFNRHEEARLYYEHALQVRRGILGEDHLDTAHTLNDLGTLYLAQGDEVTAEEFLTQAWQIRRAKLGDEHLDTAHTLNDLGTLYLAQEHYPSALRYLTQALEIRQTKLGDNHSETAQTLENIGLLFHSQKEYAEAQRYYEQALVIYKLKFGPDHPRTQAVLDQLAEIDKLLQEINTDDRIKIDVKVRHVENDLSVVGIRILKNSFTIGSNVLINPADQRDQRDRQRILQLVKRYWVEGVLEQLLDLHGFIELSMQEQPAAVENRPWEMVLQTSERSPRLLPPGTKIIEIYDDMDQALLILGGPGSGKTTMLLELARDTIARAEEDPAHPIPIVFNLSSWTNKQSLAEWLIDELNSNKYSFIPRKIARRWVENGELLLLLDGLDEVALNQRKACVRAINDFHQQYLTQLVVCSRTVEYEALRTRLKLNGAICLQPLSLEQVDAYLATSGSELVTLRSVLQKDRVLQELVQSPLMLSIMILEYRDVALESLLLGSNTIVESRNHFFDSYVRRMARRKVRDSTIYTAKQTNYWLAWLARQMSHNMQTIFSIEEMQPDWLSGQMLRRLYGFGVLLSLGLTIGLAMRMIAASAIMLSTNQAFNLSDVLVSGLLFSLPVMLALTLYNRLAKNRVAYGQIQVVERLSWSWREGRGGLAVGAVSGLALSVVGTGGFLGLTFGLALGGLSVLFLGLSGDTVEVKTAPNQGIWLSGRNGLSMGLAFGLAAGLLFGVATGSVYGASSGLTGGLLAGLGVGLIAALRFGGLAYIQHFVLRFILYWNGHIPWDYARFLDHAAQRVFLRKVGGGYIFVHRLLLEHFAGLEE